MPVHISLSLRWSVIILSVFAAGCGGKQSSSPESYTRQIPGTFLSFDMIYIPGGEFDMGSPSNEAGRDEDEEPLRQVRVKPFWIGKTEVTWGEFEQYAFVKDTTVVDAVTKPSPKISLSWLKAYSIWLNQRFHVKFGDLDVVTRPSPFYGVYDHGFGTGKKPAIGVSWITAQMYCDWLSVKTGETYRLPTEAEWEFACRAGNTAAYSFGDDPDLLDDYGWHEDNSDWEPQAVGQKKPNAFGLFDMHGNVWEFCLDVYDPGYPVQSDPDHPDYNIWQDHGRITPVLRGGSWDDPPEELRSASRIEQQEWWNERDPQRPRGTWWLVDGSMVGFRVARSAK